MKMICIAALVLFTGAANAQLFDQVDEGYYRVERPDGTQLPEKFSKQTRALVAAVAEASRCACAVYIVAPRQRVTVVSFADEPKAVPKTFTFTLPTQRENGAPLSVSELKDCTVYVTGAAEATRSVDAPGTSVVIDLLPGQYNAAASCSDKNGRVSELSSVIDVDV